MTAATQDAANITRRATLYAERLKKTRGTREHLALVVGAVQEIATTSEFHRHLTELTGWKNRISWLRWIGRSLEPTMLVKMRYQALVQGLTPVMLAAGMRHAYFAERFLEEIILVCYAEQDKADVNFIVGQAFTLFGPLMAPLSAAAGAAAGAGIASMSTRGAISAGTQLAQMGTTALSKQVALDVRSGPGMAPGSGLGPTGFVEMDDWDAVVTRGRSSTIYAAPTAVETKSVASAEERTHYSVNPMQYAVCLFKYLTNLTRPTRVEQIVINEFGGMARLTALYDFIKHPPL